MKETMRFLILTLLALSGCATNDLSSLRTRVLADPSVSSEIKAAIEKRIIIPGMCPQETFAAAGYPGPYMVQKDMEKWKGVVPPPVIIEAQCTNPDNSVIELM